MSYQFDRDAAIERYENCNERALRWMLARAPLQNGYLNTKMNSITLEDYTNSDGMRGPKYTYGWIQGRGLEAIASHAVYYSDRDTALSAALDIVGKRLYKLLTELQVGDGHVYFCYDANMVPVRQTEGGVIVPQHRLEDVYTYSDAFAAKGLVAAAARYAPEDLPTHLIYLSRVVQAISGGRFQMAEKVALGLDSISGQPNDYGPRMILLGACGMLERIGQPNHATFGREFIEHTLKHHYDEESGLLKNIPGCDACNLGHGIELVGFALDYDALASDRALTEQLVEILISSFNAGFSEPGIPLSVSARTSIALNSYCPWWSLPETIRAAALASSITDDPKILEIWAKAHNAFFDYYWRNEVPISYQTRDANGPVDFVPATPDLDPGYHTGLSFLAAINAHSPKFLNTTR